jgi:CII-binding regulator of phage lambda lysogenization HflD
MNWQEQAASSHYQTAVSIREELGAGHIEDAKVGIEELVDALSRSDRRALKSQLVRLMAHMLKWQTRPERRSRNWSATIRSARKEIREIQEDTPSLTDEVIHKMWDTCFGPRADGCGNKHDAD